MNVRYVKVQKDASLFIIYMNKKIRNKSSFIYNHLFIKNTMLLFMRNAILFAALLLINTTAKSQAKKIAAETSIKNVTIFSSGARVERLSSVSIPSGRSEISFSGLSNQLDQQSVQLKADADITLLSVKATKDSLSARKIDEEEKSFIDRNNTLQDKLDLDNKLLEVYKNEETMLIKMRPSVERKV